MHTYIVLYLFKIHLIAFEVVLIKKIYLESLNSNFEFVFDNK